MTLVDEVRADVSADRAETDDEMHECLLGLSWLLDVVAFGQPSLDDVDDLPPGVAPVRLAIAKNKQDARRLTIKSNSIAVISDGSAFSGLGNIGPEPPCR